MPSPLPFPTMLRRSHTPLPLSLPFLISLPAAGLSTALRVKGASELLQSDCAGTGLSPGQQQQCAGSFPFLACSPQVIPTTGVGAGIASRNLPTRCCPGLSSAPVHPRWSRTRAHPLPQDKKGTLAVAGMGGEEWERTYL